MFFKVLTLVAFIAATWIIAYLVDAGLKIVLSDESKTQIKIHKFLYTLIGVGIATLWIVTH